jgi:hypothetical protein
MALEGVRSLPNERYNNLVRLYPHNRSHPLGGLAGLTIEETIEFGALDALPPFDDNGVSKRRALVAENVVSRGSMEKEVRQRERHQEAFRAGMSGGNAKHPPRGSSTLKSESIMKMDLRDV